MSLDRVRAPSDEECRAAIYTAFQSKELVNGSLDASSLLSGAGRVLSDFLRESTQNPDEPFIPRAVRASFELLSQLREPGDHAVFGPAHLFTIIMCEFLHGLDGELDSSFLYSDVQLAGGEFLRKAVDRLVARVMSASAKRLSPLEQRILEEYIRVIHHSACSIFHLHSDPYPVSTAPERVLSGEDRDALSSLSPADRELFSGLEELAGRSDQLNPLRVISTLLRKLFPKATCGRFVNGGIAYRCQTCSRDRSSMYCPDCFNPEQHAGHDYIMLSNVLGMCDCGCIQSISPCGFCQAHRGNAVTDTLARQLGDNAAEEIHGIPRAGLALLPFLNWRAILASQFLLTLAYFHEIALLSAAEGCCSAVVRSVTALTTLFQTLTKIPDLNFFDELLTKAVIYRPLFIRQEVAGGAGEDAVGRPDSRSGVRYVPSPASLNDILFARKGLSGQAGGDDAPRATVYGNYISHQRASELGFAPFYRDQLSLLRRIMKVRLLLAALFGKRQDFQASGQSRRDVGVGAGAENGGSAGDGSSDASFASDESYLNYEGTEEDSRASSDSSSTTSQEGSSPIASFSNASQNAPENDSSSVTSMDTFASASDLLEASQEAPSSVVSSPSDSQGPRPAEPAAPAGGLAVPTNPSPAPVLPSDFLPVPRMLRFLRNLVVTSSSSSLSSSPELRRHTSTAPSGAAYDSRISSASRSGNDASVASSDTSEASDTSETSETSSSSESAGVRGRHVGFRPFERLRDAILRAAEDHGPRIQQFAQPQAPQNDLDFEEILHAFDLLRGFDLTAIEDNRVGLRGPSGPPASSEPPALSSSSTSLAPSALNPVVSKLLGIFSGDDGVAVPDASAQNAQGGANMSAAVTDAVVDSSQLSSTLLGSYCDQSLIFFVMLLSQLDQLCQLPLITTSAFTCYFFKDMLGEPMYRSYMTYVYDFEYPLTLANNLENRALYTNIRSPDPQAVLEHYTTDNIIVWRRLGSHICSYREYSVSLDLLHGKLLGADEAVQFRYETANYDVGNALYDIRYRNHQNDFTSVPVQLCTHLTLERHKAVETTNFMLLSDSAVIDSIAMNRAMFPTVFVPHAAFPAPLPRPDTKKLVFDFSQSYRTHVLNLCARAPGSPLSRWAIADASSFVKGMLELLAGLYPAGHDFGTGEFTFHPNSMRVILHPDQTVFAQTSSEAFPASIKALVARLVTTPMSQFRDTAYGALSGSDERPDFSSPTPQVSQDLEEAQLALQATPLWQATSLRWEELCKYIAFLEFKSADNLDYLFSQKALRRLGQNIDILSTNMLSNPWVQRHVQPVEEILRQMDSLVAEMENLWGTEQEDAYRKLVEGMNSLFLHLLITKLGNASAAVEIVGEHAAVEWKDMNCYAYLTERLQSLAADWMLFQTLQHQAKFPSSMLSVRLNGVLNYYHGSGNIIYASKTNDFYLAAVSCRINCQTLAAQLAFFDGIRAARIKASNHRENDNDYNSILRLNIVSAALFTSDFFFGIPQSLALGTAQNIQSVQSITHADLRRTADALVPGEVEAVIVRYCSPATQRNSVFSGSYGATCARGGAVDVPRDFDLEAFNYILAKDMEAISNLTVAFISQIILAGYSHSSLMVPLGARAGCWGLPGADGAPGSVDVADPQDLLRMPDYFGMHCPYSALIQEDHRIGSGMYEWPIYSVLSQMLGLCMFTYGLMKRTRDSLRSAVLAARDVGRLDAKPETQLARLPTLPQFLRSLVEDELTDSAILEAVGFTLPQEVPPDDRSQLPSRRPELYCLFNGLNPYAYLIEDALRVIVGRVLQLGGAFVRCGAGLISAAALAHTNTCQIYYSILYNHTLVQAVLLLAIESAEQPVDRGTTAVPCTPTAIIAQILSRFGLCAIDTKSGTAAAKYSPASRIPESSTLSNKLLTEALIFVTSLYMHDYLCGDVYSVAKEMILEKLVEERSLPSDYFRMSFTNFAFFNPGHLSEMISEFAEVDSSASAHFREMYDYDPGKWGDRHCISAAGWKKVSFYSPLMRTCPDLLEKYHEFRSLMEKKGQAEHLPVIPCSVVGEAARGDVQNQILSNDLYARMCLDFFQTLILPAFSAAEGSESAGASDRLPGPSGSAISASPIGAGETGVAQTDIFLALGGVLRYVEAATRSHSGEDVLAELRGIAEKILCAASSSTAFVNRSRFLPEVSLLLERIVVALGFSCPPGTLTGEKEATTTTGVTRMKQNLRNLLRNRKRDSSSAAQSTQPAGPVQAGNEAHDVRETPEGRGGNIADSAAAADAVFDDAEDQHALLLLHYLRDSELDSGEPAESSLSGASGGTTRTASGAGRDSSGGVLDEFAGALATGLVNASRAPILSLPEELRPVDVDSFGALFKLIASGSDNMCSICHDPENQSPMVQMATVTPTSYQYMHSRPAPSAEAPGAGDLLFHPWVKSLVHYLENQRLNLESSDLARMYDPVFARAAAPIAYYLCRVVGLVSQTAETKMEWTRTSPTPLRRLLQVYEHPPAGIPPLNSAQLRDSLLVFFDDTLQKIISASHKSGMTAVEKQFDARALLEKKISTLTHLYLRVASDVESWLKDAGHSGVDAQEDDGMRSKLQFCDDVQREPFLFTLTTSHGVLAGQYALRLAEIFSRGTLTSAKRVQDLLATIHKNSHMPALSRIAVNPYDALKLKYLDETVYRSGLAFIAECENRDQGSPKMRPAVSKLYSDLVDTFTRFGLEEQRAPPLPDEYSPEFLASYPLLRYDAASDRMVAQGLLLTSYLVPGKEYEAEHFSFLSHSSGTYGLLYDQGIQGVLLNPPVIPDMCSALTPVLTNEIGFHVKGCRHALHLSCYSTQRLHALPKFTSELSVRECSLCQRQSALVLPIVMPFPGSQASNQMLDLVSKLFETLWSRIVMRGIHPQASSIFGVLQLSLFFMYHGLPNATAGAVSLSVCVLNSVGAILQAAIHPGRSTPLDGSRAEGTFGAYFLECLRLVFARDAPGARHAFDSLAARFGGADEADAELRNRITTFLDGLPSYLSLGERGDAGPSEELDSQARKTTLAAIGLIFLEKLTSQAMAVAALFVETALYNVFSVYRLVVSVASVERESAEGERRPGAEAERSSTACDDAVCGANEPSQPCRPRNLSRVMTKPLEELRTAVDYSTSILQLAIYVLQLARGDVAGGKTLDERARLGMLPLDTKAERDKLERSFTATLRSPLDRTAKAGLLHNILQRYLLLAAVESLGSSEPGSSCFPAVDRLSASLDVGFYFLVQAAGSNLSADLLELQLEMTYAAVAGTPGKVARRNYMKYLFYLKRTPEGSRKAAEDQLLTATTESGEEFAKAAALELRQCFVSLFTDLRLMELGAPPGNHSGAMHGLRSSISAVTRLHDALERTRAAARLGLQREGGATAGAAPGSPVSYISALLGGGPGHLLSPAAGFTICPALRLPTVPSLPLTSADAQILATGHKPLCCKASMQHFTPANSWMAVCMFCGELLCPFCGQWTGRVRRANPQGPSGHLRNALYLYKCQGQGSLVELKVAEGLELHAAQCCQQICAYFPRFNYILCSDSNFFVRAVAGPYLTRAHIPDPGYRSGEGLTLSPGLLFALQRSLMFETAFEAPLGQEFRPRQSLDDQYSAMQRLGVDEAFEDEWV